MLNVLNFDNKSYSDKLMYGVHDAFALAITAVRDGYMIFHGVPGCRIAKEHIRTENIPNGTYVPILTTSPLETDIIQGGTFLIEKAWRYAMETDFQKKKPRFVMFFTSCATSLNEDDINASADKFERETGIKAIVVDTPNFLGSEATGIDLAYTALVENFAEEGLAKKKDCVNLAGVHLIGSKFANRDVMEMKRLLNAIDIEVNCMLTMNTPVEDIAKFYQAESCLMLTGEELPSLFELCQDKGMEFWGRDLVLPYGIANTEEWLLKVAERFGKVDKAKQVLQQEMTQLRKGLAGDYNASWTMSDVSSKRVGIIGYAPFAAAMARCLYYDFNIKPEVVALLSETEEAITNVMPQLEEMGEFLNLDVFQNPSSLEYGKAIKAKNVDFTVGRRFDRILSEGLAIPHLSMGGRYFMNQFNFIPWPLAGIKGTYAMLGDLALAMERMRDDNYRDSWKTLSFI